MEAVEQDRLLTEQLEFYREGAEAFDRWLEIVMKTPSADGFYALAERVTRYAPLNNVLEIAAGTGRWTSVLATTATSVTALDASPESLAIAADKLADHRNVRFVLADVLSWESDVTYDTIFFGDWLAHVPEARFHDFWSVVDRALAPDGLVLFSDQLPRPSGSSTTPADIVDAVGPQVITRSRFDANEQVSYREFADGRTFRVIARYYESEDLEKRLSQLGWTAHVEVADNSREYLAAVRRRQ